MSEARLERWKAVALLLPALVLAWPGPGSLLRHDFVPHATGAGVAALAALPAAALIAFRRGAVRSSALLFALLGVLGSIAARGATDGFEVRRMGVHFATSLVLLVGGAGLGAEGLKVYARGAVCVALLLLACALADAANLFAGALGNSGSVAMAALPGALAGAVLLVVERGAWRIAGGLAIGLFLVYVLRVPVVAGGLAAGAGLGAFALARVKGRGALVAAITVLAVLAAVAAIAVRPGGGVEVRARVWRSSLALLRDHPGLGVGPGQFAAAFPPYRDPKEIELSTHGRAIGAETEVEHPHQDWLRPAIELGLVSGLLWIGFLAFVAAGAWKAMREAPGPRAALAAAAIGVLAYALVHAPLTQEPAAASIAFVAFGAVLARPGRAAGWPYLALLLVAALPARAFVRHGLWLASLASPEPQDASRAEHAIESALSCCHDSVEATALLARFHEQRGSDSAVVVRHGEGVLAHRPHRIEALMEVALARLKTGDFDAARASYERALALDPGHPGIAKNLRLLDLQSGALQADGDPSPESCWARSRKEREGGDPLLADVLEARAHRLWARGHAAGGRFADAVRSYRQALRVVRGHFAEGPPRIRLELAAALAADRRDDEARAEIEGLATSPSDRASLPDWTAPQLRRIGFGD